MTDHRIETSITGGQIQGVAGAGTVVIENFTIYNRAVEEPAIAMLDVVGRSGAAAQSNGAPWQRLPGLRSECEVARRLICVR